MRRGQPKKTKEERRAEMIIALIFLIVLFAVAFIRQSWKQQTIDEIKQEYNSVQQTEQ